MSYDIFCYKSKIGVPDVEEAQIVIEREDERENMVQGAKLSDLKLSIVNALMSYNSNLEVFGISDGEVDDDFKSIEIEHTEVEFNLQIFIHDDMVSFNLPYHLNSKKAESIFHFINEYIKIIGKTAGYFVFDPQLGLAYDPTQAQHNGLNKYLAVRKNMTCSLSSPNLFQSKKKPWWKIW